MEYTFNKVGTYNEQDLVEYVLKNDNGVSISVLNLGGIITGIYTPDKEGRVENVVLGYKNIEDYFENHSYYGAIIGRFAGRIFDGKLTIEDKEYSLVKNHLNASNLHGGEEGFHKKLWNVEPFSTDSEVGLVLKYLSKDGEEGFPGQIEVQVKYILNNNNELSFNIEGETDKATVLNITNHSYFNLSGNASRNVLEHELRIDADKYLEISEVFVPTGSAIDVNNTPFDFRNMKAIGKDINKHNKQLELANGYDHPFKFTNGIGTSKLIDEKSGRSMEIETDNGYVVVYTTNYPSDKELPNGKVPEKNMAICLETQNAPIGINQCNIEESLLKPGQRYSRYTKYKFDIVK